MLDFLYDATRHAAAISYAIFLLRLFAPLILIYHHYHCRRLDTPAAACRCRAMLLAFSPLDAIFFAHFFRCRCATF